MRKIMMLVLGLAAFLMPGVSRAQLAAPNDAGVSMGHVHMFVQDVDAAVARLEVDGLVGVIFSDGFAPQIPKGNAETAGESGSLLQNRSHRISVYHGAEGRVEPVRAATICLPWKRPFSMKISLV